MDDLCGRCNPGNYDPKVTYEDNRIHTHFSLAESKDKR